MQLAPRTSDERRMHRYLWRLAEVAALVVFLAVIFTVFAFTFRFVVPFVIGWLLAILLLPLVKFLERRRLPRVLAVLVPIIALIVVMVLLAVFGVVALARESTQLLVSAPAYFHTMQQWVRLQASAGEAFFRQLPPSVASGMESTALHAAATVEETFRHVATHLLDSLTHLPEKLFVLVISFVAAFFMLLNRERMYRRLMRTLPPGWSDKLQTVFNDMVRAFVGTVRAQVLLMALSAGLGMVGMWVMHIQYAVLLGIIFGLTGLVPMLGSAILTVPWAAGALLFGDTSLAIKVILLQAVISIIRHIVEPKILADNVGLDTLSTLFGLYVGMKTIGIIGLFLGPIILIGLKSLLRARMFVGMLPGIEEPPLPTALQTDGVRETQGQAGGFDPPDRGATASPASAGQRSSGTER